ncbi:MAG: S9 family peptidase [bacterium]|nr:S9 family peptidase [bacterium]
MKRLALVSIALIALLVTSCSVGGPSTAGAHGGKAPLLDRELFFGDPEISYAQLSPDGKYMAFVKPYRDVRNIYVKKIDEPFDAAQPITADKRPVPGYFWSRDSKYVLYVQDKDGNENYHVFAVDPTGERKADSGVPEARNLTPIEGVRAAIYSVPKNKPNEIVVGLNDRDPMFHDVYRIDLADGKRTLLIENTQKVGSWVYDLDGNVRMALRQTGDGSTEFLRVKGDKLTPVYGCNYEESCSPYRFHKDGKRLYVSSNKGEHDLNALMLLDVKTGDTELVESDPESQVDFGGAAFADDSDELIATFYVGDRVRIYPKEKATETDLEFLRKELPDGELSLASSTRDRRYMLVSVSSDIDPGSVYLYDRENRTVELQYRSRPDLPIEHMASMKPIRYKARDGLEIPAYLTLPNGVPAKNLPTIIHPHGGPWARDNWGYDSYAQFLANRGYAVLQMNFRGSSGYGKAFLNAGNREWGTGAMQHDITDGVKHLIAEGIADPQRIGIFGGSYGGYATLAGVTFTPDLYAAGVPYVAPSNIITLIESFPAYWRPWLEGSWYKRVGDPEVAADREDMEARSPLNFVEKIQAPLLVVHGANDPRVKQVESARIVTALAEKDSGVEYIVAPDEGHGFRAPGNRMALAAAMEKFLAKHLGGEYQEDVTDAITARLHEITIDAREVSLAGDSAGEKQGAGGS